MRRTNEERAALVGEMESGEEEGEYDYLRGGHELNLKGMEENKNKYEI